MQYGIGRAPHPFASRLPRRRAQLSSLAVPLRIYSCGLRRQRTSFPARSGVGYCLIRTGFVLTPDLQPGRFPPAYMPARSAPFCFGLGIYYVTTPVLRSRWGCRSDTRCGSFGRNCPHPPVPAGWCYGCEGSHSCATRVAGAERPSGGAVLAPLWVSLGASHDPRAGNGIIRRFASTSIVTPSRAGWKRGLLQKACCAAAVPDPHARCSPSASPLNGRKGSFCGIAMLLLHSCPTVTSIPSYATCLRPSSL